MARYIDADKLIKMMDCEYKESVGMIQNGESHLDTLAEGYTECIEMIEKLVLLNGTHNLIDKDIAEKKLREKYDGITESTKDLYQSYVDGFFDAAQIIWGMEPIP